MLRFLPSLWAFFCAGFFTWLMWDSPRGVCWPCPVIFTVIGMGMLVNGLSDQIGNRSSCWNESASRNVDGP